MRRPARTRAEFERLLTFLFERKARFVTEMLADMTPLLDRLDRARASKKDQERNPNLRAELERQYALVDNIYLAALGVPVVRQGGMQRLAVLGILEHWLPRLNVGDEGQRWQMLHDLEAIDPAFAKNVEWSDADWAFFGKKGRSSVNATVHLLKLYRACGVGKNDLTPRVREMLVKARRRAAKTGWSE